MIKTEYLVISIMCSYSLYFKSSKKKQQQKPLEEMIVKSQTTDCSNWMWKAPVLWSGAATLTL